MRKAISVFSLVLLLAPIAAGFDKGSELNAPPAAAVREQVKRAVELAGNDRAEEAVAELKKARAAAPNYLRAHAEYIRIKTYYLNRYDEVRAEYDALIAREPENPVLLMALATGQYVSPSKRRNIWYQKVAELAPDWAWGHYAKAQLLTGKDWAGAAAELSKAIEKDPDANEVYAHLLRIQEKRLENIDDALATAEKMAARPETRSQGMKERWRLRLAKAGATEEARTKLKEELAALTASSKELDVLAGVHSTYLQVFTDVEGAKAVEAKIKQIDPLWFSERGLTTMFLPATLNTIHRPMAISGRDLSIWAKSDKDPSAEPKQKLKNIENALALNPGENMKRFLYEQAFAQAEKAGDAETMIKYAKLLKANEPEDSPVPARIALALADQKKELQKALDHARMAEKMSVEFRPIPRPANVNAEEFAELFTEEVQKKNYQRRRAQALESLGWVLHQSGKHDEAEPKLRGAVEVGRSEKRLWRLSEALAGMGRKEEAEKIAAEAKMEFAETIKKRFINEPSKDFELTTIDGRKVKLSELKGKAVMIDFWATWCGPCVAEMPHLVKLYDKYKAAGLEILAISCDDKADLHKVAPFAKEHKLNFPVLVDQGVGKLYNVNGYPTSIFIDKQGNIRYRDMGFGEETPRKLEVIFNELLK